jgi:DNA-binding CsgD family transcriptional regulator
MVDSAVSHVSPPARPTAPSELRVIGSGLARSPDPAVRSLREDPLWTQLHALLEPLGFSRWSYCAVPTCYALGPPDPVRVITYPAGWVREFVERGFASYSPVLAYAMARRTPGEFSQVGDQGIRAVRLREVLDLNHGFGVTTGFVLPLRNGLGMTGALALVFDGGARECARAFAQHAPALDARARELHRTVLDRYANVFCAGLVPSLSERQREVVRLLALGLGSAAIGESLGVSIHTVDKHVARAKRALGVQSSAQLTAMALRWGLIA